MIVRPAICLVVPAVIIGVVARIVPGMHAVGSFAWPPLPAAAGGSTPIVPAGQVAGAGT